MQKLLSGAEGASLGIVLHIENVSAHACGKGATGFGDSPDLERYLSDL